MVKEWHNIAARIIAKAISKGANGGNTVYTDIGSTAKMAEQANLLQTEPFPSGSILISIQTS